MFLTCRSTFIIQMITKRNPGKYYLKYYYSNDASGSINLTPLAVADISVHKISRDREKVSFAQFTSTYQTAMSALSRECPLDHPFSPRLIEILKQEHAL